jgi:hypothetical protein
MIIKYEHYDFLINKNMKRNNMLKMFLSAGFVIGIATACSDEFLTREPQGQYPPASLQTAKGVEGILIGAYAMIDGFGLDGQAPWNNDIQNWVFGGLTSDDAYKGTDAGDQPEQSFLERWDFQATNDHIKNKYRGLFKGVARTNDAINTLKNVKDLTPERATQIKAEAQFLRAFYHFEAKKMFKNIPYIDEKMFSLIDLESTKVPVDPQAWAKIEGDLTAAAAVLPDKQTQVGRPTKWAAKALLAKAKMFQGWNISTGAANATKLTEAKAILEEIVNSGKYRLVDLYRDNHDASTRNNAESIFEVQYASSSNSGAAANVGVELAHPYTSPWGCCGFYQPSQNLVNAFKTENGLPMLETFNNSDVKNDQGLKLDAPFSPYEGELDPRLDHTVGRRGILFIDYKIHNVDFIRDQTYAGPYSPKKHIPSKIFTGVNSSPSLTSNNYRILRYSMILLWLAECEVEIGSLEKARALVNQIRTRAANPNGFVQKATQGAKRDDYTLVFDATGKPVPAANYKINTYNGSWTDKDLARKAVRFETRLEFAMEGHRFFDLQRWGISAEVLNKYNEVEATKRVYKKGANFVKGKHEFFPLPQEAIDRSEKNGKATLEQDPAYR